MAKKTTRKAARATAPKSSCTGKCASWGTESLESMFKNFPQAPAGFNFDQVKEQMDRIGLLRGYGDAAQVNKDNVEAAIRSSQVIAKAAEELGKAIYGFTQSSMELGVQAGQAALNVKTLKDLVDVQSEYARNSMDHLISGTSKISDMAVKIANEVMEPISQRVNEAVEKIGRAA